MPGSLAWRAPRADDIVDEQIDVDHQSRRSSRRESRDTREGFPTPFGGRTRVEYLSERCVWSSSGQEWAGSAPRSRSSSRDNGTHCWSAPAPHRRAVSDRRVSMPLQRSPTSAQPKTVIDHGNTATGRRVYDWTVEAGGQGPWRGGVVRRADLYAALSSRIRADVHYGHACVGVDQKTSGAQSVRFEDGLEEAGDVVVAADGLRSTLRRQLFADGDPIYRGSTSFRGVAQITPSDRESHHRELGTRPPGRSGDKSRTRLDVLVHCVERTTGIVRTGGGGEADARPLSRLA